MCILSYSIALYTIFIAYTPRSSGEAPARRRAAARRRRGAGYRGGAPEGWARGAGGLGLEARAPEWRGGGGRGLEAQGSRAQKAEGWSRCIKAQIQHGSTQRSRARHDATQQATKQTRHIYIYMISVKNPYQGFEVKLSLLFHKLSSIVLLLRMYC